MSKTDLCTCGHEKDGHYHRPFSYYDNLHEEHGSCLRGWVEDGIFFVPERGDEEHCLCQQYEAA